MSGSRQSVSGLDSLRRATVSDTRLLTAEQLAAIGPRHGTKPPSGAQRVCFGDGQPWPCDTARLLGHIEALTARLEAATYVAMEAKRVHQQMADRGSVLPTDARAHSPGKPNPHYLYGKRSRRYAGVRAYQPWYRRLWWWLTVREEA